MVWISSVRTVPRVSIDVSGGYNWVEISIDDADHRDST
jgi:hypothetical protein